jgi:hypothetical protein
MSLRRNFDRLAGHDRKHDKALGLLKSIDGRLQHMTKATDDEALAISNLTTAVESMISKIGELTAAISAANAKDDSAEIEANVSKINDLTSRVQSVLPPAQAATATTPTAPVAPIDPAPVTPDPLVETDHTTDGTALGVDPAPVPVTPAPTDAPAVVTPAADALAPAAAGATATDPVAPTTAV